MRHSVQLAFLATFLTSSFGLAQTPSVLSVDLARGISRGTVPFDIPIILTGSAPKELDSIAPFIRQVPQPGLHRCPAKLRKPDGSPADSFAAAGATWRRATPLVDSFVVSLTPFEPDRDYLICLQTFSQYSEAEYPKFRGRIATRIDSLFQTRKPRTENGVERFAPLDSADVVSLVAVFKRSVTANTVPVKGSIFASDSAAEADRLKNLLELKEPLNERLNAINQLRGSNKVVRCGDGLMQPFCGDTAMLRGALQRVPRTSGTALRRLLDRITSRDTIFGRTQEMNSAALEAARVLLVPTPGLADRIAGAQTALTDSGVMAIPLRGTLESIWSADSAAARLANARRTRGQVEQLRALAAAVAASPQLRRKVGITQPAADSLVARLDQLRSAAGGLEASLARFTTASQERDRKITDAVNALTAFKEASVPVLGSTVELNLETRARRYLSAELGLAYGTQIDQAVPYFGVTVFPGGVNRQVPQRLNDPLRTRYGLMIGVTASSVAKKDERENLFGNYALLTGLTLRFADVFRFSGGAMWLRQLDSESLSDRSSVRATPYASLGFDLDIQAVLGGLGKILGGG